MFRSINAIVKKEWIQIKRDKLTLVLIIFMPILQLLATGLAIQKDLRDLPTVICDHSITSASRELIDSLENSHYFEVKYQVESQQKILKTIQAGKAQVGIIIPDDYKKKLLKGQTAEVRMIVDGSNAGAARLAMNMGSLVVSNISTKILEDKINKLSSATDDFTVKVEQPITMKSQVLYNPDLKFAFFIVPGLLGMILQMLTMLFTGFAIVRERERGTLEQLMVTPIKSTELMLGKLIPYTAIGFIDMILALAVMIWFFDIKVSGQMWVLIVTSTIFLICSLAIGMLISTFAQTQVQAIQITFSITVPTLLLTGFVFPLEPIPMYIKWMSYCLPLTYYLDIIRGIVIRGAGMLELWPQTLILIAFSVGLIFLSVIRFRKKIA
ncbi:MAG: ABC transporter permease [Cyanobacteriota bacterium]